MQEDCHIPAEMQAAEGAGRLAASAPLSQASTACASPMRDAYEGLHADVDDSNMQEDFRIPAEMQAAEGAGRLAASAPLSQASTACASPIRDAYEGLHADVDDSDEEGLHADVDDDNLHNLKHECDVVSDDEMQARVASAMCGIDRLERMNIDPHELPTIRALFVRWTIFRWALEGPSCTRRPAMQQQAPAGHSDTKHNLMAGRCSGKDTNHVSHRKRARGDIDSCVAEVAPLGCIRGPGCGVARARRTSTPSL